MTVVRPESGWNGLDTCDRGGGGQVRTPVGFSTRKRRGKAAGFKEGKEGVEKGLGTRWRKTGTVGSRLAVAMHMAEAKARRFRAEQANMLLGSPATSRAMQVEHLVRVDRAGRTAGTLGWERGTRADGRSEATVVERRGDDARVSAIVYSFARKLARNIRDDVGHGVARLPGTDRSNNGSGVGGTSRARAWFVESALCRLQKPI